MAVTFVSASVIGETTEEGYKQCGMIVPTYSYKERHHNGTYRLDEDGTPRVQHTGKYGRFW